MDLAVSYLTTFSFTFLFFRLPNIILEEIAKPFNEYSQFPSALLCCAWFKWFFLCVFFITGWHMRCAKVSSIPFSSSKQFVLNSVYNSNWFCNQNIHRIMKIISKYNRLYSFKSYQLRFCLWLVPSYGVFPLSSVLSLFLCLSFSLSFLSQIYILLYRFRHKCVTIKWLLKAVKMFLFILL